MMPVFKAGNSYLVLPYECDIDKYKDLLSYKLSIHPFKSIRILELNAKAFSIVTKMYRDDQLLKVMDTFYFPIGATTGLTYSEFFDYVAAKYESLIDTSLNKSLIKNYLTIISQENTSNTTLKVLDVGSGTGISTKVKTAQKEFVDIKLFGYESSKKMEAASKVSGLEMLNPKTLKLHHDYFFDAIFGSYSFHFITDNSTLHLLWQKLKIGGFLIANFHKDIQLENALIFFHSIGASIVKQSNHGNSSVYIFTKTSYPFIRIDDRDKFSQLPDSELLDETGLFDHLINFSIIPSYEITNHKYLLHEDLIRLQSFFNNIRFAGYENAHSDLYEKIFVLDSGSIRLEFRKNLPPINFDFNPAVLISLLSKDDGQNDQPPFYIQFGEYLRVEIRSAKLKRIYKEAAEDKNSIDSARAPLYANSASYMGSKKSLRHFLFSAVKSVIKQPAEALDLMCGAGTVASILAMRYDTFASDAMHFSRILAIVQGSGFTSERAEKVLENINEPLIKNLKENLASFDEAVKLEDEFFHMRVTEDSKSRYQEFCEKYSFKNASYSSKYNANIGEPLKFPYDLFSLAYSNIFFGTLQSIQIDSLRYAISQLQDTVEKDWALGALIATISATANTYAGHFAQPKYKDTSLLSDSHFIRLIEQRSLSILNEFEIRFLAFANESQSKQLSVIKPVGGPWLNAIQQFTGEQLGKRKFIYVDAPYTRDEYSRYYHVLETVVDYSFHRLAGHANIPDKKEGARFKSNFFTRDLSKLKSEFLAIFRFALENNCICGWSYSNGGLVDTYEVIYEIVQNTGCEVKSFEIPYEYKGQGGRRPKHIKEYLIFFIPKININKDTDPHN